MSPFIFSQKTNLFFHSYFVTPITHLYSQPLQSSFLLAFHTCFISYDFHSDLNLFSLMFFITMFSNRLTVLSFPLSSYYTYYLLLFSHTSFDLFGQYISWSIPLPYTRFHTQHPSFCSLHPYPLCIITQSSSIHFSC